MFFILFFFFTTVSLTSSENVKGLEYIRHCKADIMHLWCKLGLRMGFPEGILQFALSLLPGKGFCSLLCLFYRFFFEKCMFFCFLLFFSKQNNCTQPTGCVQLFCISLKNTKTKKTCIFRKKTKKNCIKRKKKNMFKSQPWLID